MIDIHCHILPGIDDGATDWDTAIGMAEMAVADGIATIVATPHQLGNYRHNTASVILERVVQLRRVLRERGIPLEVLPGGDVRIEPDLADKLVTGEVLSLANQRRHVLLELPHELYFSLVPLLSQLQAIGITGVLSHPERNRGIQAVPRVVEQLVDAGCLMQVTAGSLLGSFGPTAEKLAGQLVCKGLCHFVATDAHGVRARRPRLMAAQQHVADLIGEDNAHLLCVDYPARVAAGKPVPTGRLQVPTSRRRRWFGLGRVAS